MRLRILPGINIKKMDDNDKDEEIIEDEYIEETGLNEKLKKIREELKECQKEKAEYLAGWQRAKADFINARKDEEKSRAEFAKYAAEKVLREILPILDSLEKIGNADGTAIYKQLMQILKREGVEEIKSVGLVFNPMYHEALGQTETDKKEEDGVILEELQKGYMLYDKVLRPSKVKVGVYKT